MDDPPRNTGGGYELFIYNNGFIFQQGRNSGDKAEDTSTQIYRFKHQDGKEEITLETNTTGNGWISLGSYRFKAGPAHIILSDKGSSPSQPIVADTVKWVKKELSGNPV